MKKKNSILKFIKVLILLCFTLLFSCTPKDGRDGKDGLNGKNGNANVQTYFYPISSTGKTLVSLDVPAITREVLDNDAILVYLRVKSTSSYVQVPGMGGNSDHDTRAYFGENDNSGYIGINFFGRGTGFTTPTTTGYDAVKVVIIKSSSTRVVETAR